MQDEYHRSEEDIQKILRYLQIHDPKMPTVIMLSNTLNQWKVLVTN
jgi:hypothetical protein